MMEMPWTHCLFAIATVITIPLYLFILFAILWRPKLTPFHTLMISQGIVDIYSLLSYNFFIVLRVSGLCSDLFWENQPSIAIASFINTYFTLYLRCIGIALISVQRYITVCLFGTKIERLMMETPPLVLAMIHWSSGFLLTATLLTTSFDIRYDNKEDMNMIVPVKTLSLANLISVISVVILFLICILCYVSVISYIIRSKIAANSTRRQEIRLSIQVAGLLVAFLLVFIYSVGNYVINELRKTSLLYEWRELNPIMFGFLSCVLPWTCLFFNEDIQKRLPRIFKCRRRTLSSSGLLASRASAW
ncbi:hypothetical protein Y032_0006g2951 [Ancylostoma ceylanicum]|uniref:G-protein coupled receptors family 1 profile domain-containing protein n=3 Tax=Ancylostoma ceylanicum TaxID=53326 RepID=A0A016VRH2_9BILA|nr:hypothetical protein Y032_0006g2951 [Ancylostoma ceylanicum]